MANVYVAQPLYERVPKTYKLTPISDYWYLQEGGDTLICDEPGHSPNCIKFWTEWYRFVFGGWGYWKLKAPINVRSDMPGSAHRLAAVQFDSLFRPAFGTAITVNTRRFSVLNHDTNDIIWSVSDQMISQGENRWESNKYSPNVDVSNIANINVELYSSIKCVTGAFSTHFANFIISFEYTPSTPPEPATVSIYVYNRQNGAPVGGALTQLLSGNRVVAQGYTGVDGRVTFNNVSAGVEGISYLLTVAKSGFLTYNDTVDVKPGLNSYTVGLTQAPQEPIQWWIVAAALLGAVAVAGLFIKGREYIVVRYPRPSDAGLKLRAD